MKRKLFTMLMVVLLCMSVIAVPAFAQSNENEQPLPPLTPDGNMNLVDDMVTVSGKQFITVTSRDGNYFYIIIDRDDNGNQTVHFLNQVDEADLLSLLDEDEIKEYTQSQKPTEPAPTQPVQTKPTEPEPTTPTVPEKDNSNLSTLIPVIVFAFVGMGAFIMVSGKSKKAKATKPDPDADYQEDEEYELPSES